MNCTARGSLCLLLAGVLLTEGACKRGGQQKPQAEAPKLAPPVPVPAAVLAYIAVKNPERAINNLLAMGNALFPLPFDREALMTLIARRAGIPPA